MNTTNPTQLSLFGEAGMGRFTLEEVLGAYRVCLRGKGETCEAQEFMMSYMSRCVRLWRSLNDQSYQLSRFICFISFHPVMREIYGSKFVDRVVDTLIYLKMVPLLDQMFVDDNYSTRKGRGALYGVLHVYDMIRLESENYTQDCWILKDDIKSFFMSMEKQRIMDNWERFIRQYYHMPDGELIIATLRKIIFFRPELNRVCKGSPRNWELMPPDKLLGNKGPLRGIPIGKVISQVSALMYIDPIDHIVTFKWKLHNGHYMDDRVTVNKSRHKLLEAKQRIDRMHQEIGLKTHPRKTYLQHYTKGVMFGGSMILPGRIYLSNRTIGNCFRRLTAFNYRAQTEPDYVELHAEEFATTMNSYFGLLSHFAEWNTTHRIIREIESPWYKVMQVVGRRGRYKIRVQPRFTFRRNLIAQYRERQGYALCA